MTSYRRRDFIARASAIIKQKNTLIIIIEQILVQVKQIIVTNALYHQLPERNVYEIWLMTVNYPQL